MIQKIAALLLFILTTAISFAQLTAEKRIEDSVIGWIKIYNFKGAKASLKVDDKTFSTAQLSICDSFANWMQASYFPKGALGDIKKAVSEKLGLYNQYTAGKPQYYGAYTKTYTELKYNSSHKLVPFTNSNIWWGVFANNIPGDWAVRDICSTSGYYFTMPGAATEEQDEKVKKILDISANKNIKPYTSFWIKNTGFGGGKEHVVLCKYNRSPFIKLTKGEYLQLLEAAIPRYYEEQKKTIYEANPGNQQSIDYLMNGVNERIERFKTGLKKNKEKYKNRMNEPATTGAQPGLGDLDSEMDVFSNGYLTDTESASGRLPVYKVDESLSALCKTDKPQWILISWEYYPGDATEQQQHDAIINNFNFEYVYNFFFDPAKVKEQPYKPLHSPFYKEAVVATEASENTKKNAADKNIFFFEDFSTNAISKKPVNWRCQYGLDGATIEKLDGLMGNWIVITNNTITSNQLKKTLPQNFTLSYDLVASQNFTWGAKRLTIQLAKETTPGNAESFFRLGIRPGFDGREGDASLETEFPAPPGYNNGSKGYAAPGFSNNKKYNRITVTIKKKEEMLQVFIDNTKIAEYEKAIPAALLFNSLSFYSYNSGENDKFYISNIKITKD